MVLFRHELRQGRVSLLIWTCAVAGLLGVCVLIYPEMAEQMETVGALFSDMGAFSTAFGMDRIHFGSFPGYFAVECGNVLGLGGALFAALLGVSALSGEGADFLLTHPISRLRAAAEKLGAVFAQLALFTLCTAAVTALCTAAIGQRPPVGPMALLFLAHLLLQAHIAAVTFSLSAFLRQKNAGAGLGLAVLFYFLNLLANLTQKAAFLKYLTPFAWTEGADILTDHMLNGRYLAAGLALALATLTLGMAYYRRRDIT